MSQRWSSRQLVRQDLECHLSVESRNQQVSDWLPSAAPFQVPSSSGPPLRQLVLLLLRLLLLLLGTLLLALFLVFPAALVTHRAPPLVPLSPAVRRRSSQNSGKYHTPLDRLHQSGTGPANPAATALQPLPTAEHVQNQEGDRCHQVHQNRDSRPIPVNYGPDDQLQDAVVGACGERNPEQSDSGKSQDFHRLLQRQIAASGQILRGEHPDLDIGFDA